MLDDRSTSITIRDNTYSLVLTTRATKEISKRYGGIENLGDKLMKSENFEMALDEIVWLLTLFANQGIQISNLKNKTNDPLLTEDEVELLTSPADLADYKNALVEAMQKGTRRSIESEDTSPNVTAP